MNDKNLFTISFLINFVFSMLTTLLALIVFNINKSTTDINIVMSTFISSLLIIRMLSLVNLLKPRTEIILGSALFSVACFILLFNYKSMYMMFVGSILFGVSIALVPPAILVLLSANERNRSYNVGIYNAIVAVASVFSPIIGENIYYNNPYLLFTAWFLLALVMTIMSLLLKREAHNTEKLKEKTLFNLKNVFSNKIFRMSFVVLLFSSITYGSIVSYLPIYFEKINLSIGYYYLFFWSGYILVQFLNQVVYNFNIVILALIFVLTGQLSLVFLNECILIYLFAFVYGLGYGSLFKVFYVGIGNFEKEEERSIGFATIGLISYIGVGIAPVFLIPFNTSWEMIFLGNTCYTIIAMLIFLFLERRYGR